MGLPEEEQGPAGSCGSADPPPRRQRRLTAAADFAVAFCVATLLVTCAWKGLWILMDAAIFPGRPVPSAWTSFIVGAVSIYLHTFLRDRLQLACFVTAGGGPARRAAARGVVLLLWLGVVSLWRGIFLLMDTESGLSWLSYGMFAAAGLLVLGKLRFLATVVALPLSVDVDLPRSFFSHESPLNTTLADEYHLRSLDAFLALVISCFSTFLWRGCWGVMDKTLLPSEPPVSLAISLCLGFGLTTACYGIQWWVVKWYRSLSFLPALILHDLLILVGFVGVVNVWRGVFLFFDVVLHAGLDPTLRLGTAAAVALASAVLLVALRLSKNLLLCGVQRDVVGPLPFNCQIIDQLCGAEADDAEAGTGTDVCSPASRY